MIAMALSCNPTMLIADEPTTALDVTIQAQILELMGDLQDEFDTSIMFITHDLGVIAEITSYVVVMYLGKIVESGDVNEIYKNPTMPYTQGLMESIPSLDVDKGRLEPIKGVVPDPYDVPEGCPFNNRCPHVMDICKKKDPPLKNVAEGHKSSCWLHIDH
jgi:oligopeptide/dipeptide ABC transporter ATP-binding protein